ncbi:MAG: NAD(P)-binding domain-containing protein [Steroidobacteraceae bacterium]
MNASVVDIAIIGAGPYGLSLAAHLSRTGKSFRIFGEPMRFWSNHMPRGMRLKSEGFASSLYDPDAEFTLERYCQEQGLPYAHVGLPVPLATFIAYGREFQRRYVPRLERVDVAKLQERSPGFELTTAAGESLRARSVVVATGIGSFTYLPPALQGLPSTLVSHSSQHADLSPLKGRRVLVLGGGSSAIDIAALLKDGGAAVELVARTESIKFHDPPNEPRPLVERILEPRSGLGTGWRSRLSCDMPLVFHALPENLRIRVVERHLGPAPCWFTRDAIVDKVPLHLGATLEGAEATGSGIRVTISQNGEKKRIEAEHVIAGTGFKVALSRLAFLDETLRSRIRSTIDSPILGRRFESSVPGLYFVGISAANSFGPLLRFAFGANYAARRLSRHLAAA